MSNRRRRNNNANIPQETLERARRQAAEDGSGDEDEAAPARAEAPAPRARVSAAPVTPRRAGQTLRKRKEDEKLSSEEVAERLANPTKEVTEAELRAHYTYVINDLRSMGLLAAGLMVALVILAQVLPR